jgi:hypothetical protein
MNYYEFIDHEVGLIRSDGCSMVTGLRVQCCKVHDLEYHRGKSVSSAYTQYRVGNHDYWTAAAPITRKEADAHFKKCLHLNSPMGYLSPLAWIRYAGVRLFGGRAWDEHRRRETESKLTASVW